MSVTAADDADEPDEQPGAEGAASVWPEVTALRESALVVAAGQAGQLRRVAALSRRAERDARRQLMSGPQPGQASDERVAAAVVVLEVQTALGVSRHDAGLLIDLSSRLVDVLPATLDALAEGRLDLPRVRALAELTGLLDDATARVVEAQLLSRAGDRPWLCASPRAWRARVARAVVAADPDAVRRQRERALSERSVRAWANGDGTSQLMARGTDEDVQVADEVLTDLARALAQAERTEGVAQPRTFDQLRSDVLFDVLRRVRDGRPLPDVSVRREREIGLVLHADTFFGDGPAADDPGQRRGSGSPGPVDPQGARAQAHRLVERGSALSVLLTDATGALVRVLRFAAAPPGGWSRATLRAAVRQRLAGVAGRGSDRYTPTAAMVEQVRLRNPCCTGYDCPRPARSCDLDHDAPWPRGPTHVDNLAPRCRRDHELKTRGLVGTQLHPDGAVTTTLPSGSVHTTRPEPLPGFGVGEAYETTSGKFR